ncbi:hypothetical protein D3C81_1457050 [compost metagenome]
MQQELLVLVAAVLVHAAAGVAHRLIEQIQRVMLLDVGQRRHQRLQALVLAPGAALAAVRVELVHQHAARRAGAAFVAIGAIGEDAAAAEAGAHQPGVDIGIDQVRGRGHLRARHAAIEIAASVGRRCVKLQRGERKFLQLAHGSLMTKRRRRRTPRGGILSGSLSEQTGRRVQRGADPLALQ